ncbi:hypothetical protein SAMN05216266_113129 [Amycolatopsis marina]|uniref:Uncharacterized protein n=1 Tax=Amycolatopsis marina TaxID=490629 RepID=A0A1I1BD85_9PSEU|nr:hypothetical protein SAMN05216266_113129 [Amycolatopsis marina]
MACCRAQWHVFDTQAGARLRSATAGSISDRSVLTSAEGLVHAPLAAQVAKANLRSRWLTMVSCKLFRAATGHLWLSILVSPHSVGVQYFGRPGEPFSSVLRGSYHARRLEFAQPVLFALGRRLCGWQCAEWSLGSCNVRASPPRRLRSASGEPRATGYGRTEGPEASGFEGWASISATAASSATSVPGKVGGSQLSGSEYVTNIVTIRRAETQTTCAP